MGPSSATEFGKHVAPAVNDQPVADRDVLLEIVSDGSKSRRGFLKKAFAALAAIPAVAAISTPGSAEANHVEEPLGNVVGRRSRDAQDFFDIFRHENEHVFRVTTILGAEARPRPTFQNLVMPDFPSFLQLSNAFENVGVGAYLGAAGFIQNPEVLANAASIAFIEARHAGFLNVRYGYRITTNVFGEEQGFEMPLEQEEVVALASGFIASLNGGPPPSYARSKSAANDVAILNFALLLEQLEQEFYNINVPRFFPEAFGDNSSVDRTGGGQLTADDL